MRGWALCILLMGATSVIAQPADKLGAIREQQQLLAKELETGVLKLKPREVVLIRKDQARVQAILDGKSSLDELNVAERVELDNALERINALVVATREASEDRDVCRYERPTGSKLRKLDCMSAGDRQNHRDGARAYMEKPRICVPPGCG
ncbi:MAG: hypothetical protein ACOY37_04475 [Pseudomonadota bacterium]